MSHIVDVKTDGNTKIRSLTALKLAAEMLGLEMVDAETLSRETGRALAAGRLPYRTWGTDNPGNSNGEAGRDAHYVLRIAGRRAEANGPYEVGVVQKGDEWGLKWDPYAGGRGLQDKIGVNAGDLLMRYQMACVKLEAERAGHDVEFHQLPNGEFAAVVDRAGVAAGA